MSILSKLFGRKKDVIAINANVELITPNRDVKAHDISQNELFKTNHHNLNQFREAVNPSYWDSASDAIIHCDCGYFKKYNTPCKHIYMKALKVGTFDDLFNKGRSEFGNIFSLSDEAFIAFSEVIDRGFHDKNEYSISNLNGTEHELENKGLIVIDNDRNCHFSRNVMLNIFYIIYTFLSDPRSPRRIANQQSNEKLLNRNNREKQIESEHKRKLNATKPSNEYYDFDNKYFDACIRWEEKIDDIEFPDDINPKKRLAYFDKKMKKAKEFEAWCSEKPGGREYFEREFGLIFHEIQRELDDYMEDEYEDDKAEYEAQQNEKKLLSAMKRKILNSIKKEGQIKAADLKKMFAEEDQSIYNKALRELERSGDIIKFKEGNRNVYNLK